MKSVGNIDTLTKACGRIYVNRIFYISLECNRLRSAKRRILNCWHFLCYSIATRSFYFMKNTLFTLGLILSGVLLTELHASAQTYVASTSYGGATFELWSDAGISWSDAETDALADGGFLAVLTTSAQTTAVYNGLIGNGFFTPPGSQGNSAWLGATPADGSDSTTDPNNWAWRDDPGATWTAFDAGNFAFGEPSGDSDGLTINRYGSSQWNDDTSAGGFIVEINSVPDSGSTLTLLGGACAIAGVFKRKFRK
jgi:hypothetical protein